MYHKLVLLVSSLILGLIIVEITFTLLGIYNPRPPTYMGQQIKRKSKNFVPDKNVGWKMAPNRVFSWKTENTYIKYISNAEGFRVSKNNKKSINNKHKKIVILGDSHFWGLGLENEHTLSGILSRKFRDAEVNNLAMPGFGLDQIYLSLLHWGIPENPDLVIAGIFTDDFFRSFTAYTSFKSKPSFKTLNGQLILKTPDDRPNRFFIYMEQKLRLLEFYRDVDEWMGRFFGIGTWWRLNKVILDHLVSVCNEHKIPLIIVHIPYYTGNGFPELKKFLSEKNTTYIDLNEIAYGKLESLFFKKDKHLNKKGHRFVAKYLIRWINSNLYNKDNN